MENVSPGCVTQMGGGTLRADSNTSFYGYMGGGVLMEGSTAKKKMSRLSGVPRTRFLRKTTIARPFCTIHKLNPLVLGEGEKSSDNISTNG